MNVPMEAGSTDADYAFVHREIVAPVLDEFAPELVLVSAGSTRTNAIRWRRCG